jgi:hypothetical protein
MAPGLKIGIVSPESRSSVLTKIMIWNVVLLLVFGFFLFYIITKPIFEPVVVADNVAAELAPQFDVSEALLRHAIRQSLMQWQLNRMPAEAGPWLVMGLLLAIRTFMEWRGSQKANPGRVDRSS